MNHLFSEWKTRLSALRSVSEEPEYVDRIIKGRTDANRYVVEMFLISLLSDTIAVILTALGVIKTYNVTFTVMLLFVIFTCRLFAVILGFATHFSGKRLHVILFFLAFVSLFLDGVWTGEYIVLFFVIPIVLSIRYYDVTFAAVISGISLFGFATATFVSAFFWNLIGYTSIETTKELLGSCFDNGFFVCFMILFLIALGAVCGTVGGRMMMLEEAEMLSAQAKAEYEAAEAKTQIMISQIQPHFIYNTLNAICYLCEKEPKTAQDAIADFADYLRENLNFSSKGEMIPFDRELEHVKKYLSLEKMRFEDELQVEMDIASSDFMIPSLTVQPLVENAVKHGICHRDGGGTVKISTRENLAYYEIVISDDGVGFDPENPYSDTTRRHIGLENTRTRLEKMCHATMKIESEIGQGTKITITLPKEFEA